jgi:hypothetical protein
MAPVRQLVSSISKRAIWRTEFSQLPQKGQNQGSDLLAMRVVQPVRRIR